MKMRNYLSIDLGATSGRSIVATFDGERITMRELTRFDNPMLPIGEHIFWNLPALYNEVLKAIRLTVTEGIKIESIGIDTWGCDVAMFAKDGALLGLPYCYRDHQTEGAMEKLFERIPSKEVYEHSGIQFMPFNTIFQLDTMKRRQVEALENADKVLFIPDALAYMLTGRAVCEYTVASTSQLTNPRNEEIDPVLLDAIALRRNQFGEMVQPATLVGTLREEVQRYTGADAIKVVAVAGHDTASAVIAVPSLAEHFAYLSCGTWSLMGIESKEPIINEESYAKNFTNEGGIDHTTRFLKNICGLWLFERCRKEFDSAPASVAELAALCMQSNCEALINPDAPIFANPDSMTAAIQQYCHATKQQAPVTPADYCRCIFRSLALRYKQIIGWLEELSHRPIEVLNVIGGGSQNVYLMQFTANAINRTVICGPTECTALGNALVQMRADNVVGDLAAMRRISAASVALKEYQPADVAEWEALYDKFIEIQELEKQSNL